MIASRTRYMTSIEEKVNQHLADTGLTIQVLAKMTGILLPKLRTLCEGNNPTPSSPKWSSLARPCASTRAIFCLPTSNKPGSLRWSGKSGQNRVLTFHRHERQSPTCQTSAL